MISNNGRAELFERCNREYFLSHEFNGTGLVPWYTADYFADGIATHAGLAEYYRASPLDVVNSAVYEEYERLVPNPSAETITWAQNLIKSYSTRGEPEDDFSVMEIETEFRVVLGEICWSCGEPYPVEHFTDTNCPCCSAPAHWWVGRADLVVGRNGGIHIIDHKTTKGSANSNYIDSFNHSFQLIGYAYGIGKQSSVKIDGYSVNVLKKLKNNVPYNVQCRNCKGKGQLKTKACSKCGASGYVTKEPKQLFIRKWFNHTAHKQDVFLVNRLNTLNRIEEERKKFDNPETRAESFPMNPKQCHLMRGGGKCIFADTVCWNPTVRPDRWWEVSEAQLAQEFTERHKDYVTLAEEELD